MKIFNNCIVSCVTSLSALCLGATAFSLQAQSVDAPSTVLASTLNPAQLTTLTGNVHRLAQRQFDRGAAPADLPMERMLLVLKRSPQQESALTQFLEEQQDPNSANYHHWITAPQFGSQFGLSDADLQVVEGWLRSSGFEINRVGPGRTYIEFSGTAAGVQTAFHTAIHSFLVRGRQHWANTSDPQIPAALEHAVAGVATLHNFFSTPQVQLADEHVLATLTAGSPQPQYTSGGSHALTPADYATIYNINPLYQAGVNGSGTSIAVVGRTNINVADVNSFRSVFGLPSNSPQVVVNGNNPGDLGGGEELEAVLDTTWAGAVARNAQVKLVVSASTNTSDGVFLSEQYIIDNNLANVMTESFGDCEANYTSAQAAQISSMAQQAAAEGITLMVSAGDSGSAGCDDFNNETSVKGPISPNILASTPYTVAVGGTQYDDTASPGSYWSASNGTGYGSALSYVPEDVWNANCTEFQCGTGSIIGGGGGRSQFFPKPSWQSGVTGIPNDGARDIPDVSLAASGHTPYFICIGGSCTPNSKGQISLSAVYGTSAAAPSFAGIMALVNQKTGSRQGQANIVLYKMAGTQNPSSCNGSSTSGLPPSGCIFNDVTVGTNAEPGEPGYNTGNETYLAGVGYDLASGLGSVNAANLVNNWGAGPVSGPPTGFQQVPGTLSNVKVGGDGTAWGTNSASQVFSYNAQSGAFQQFSISLSQISVGSSSAVWGLDSGGNIYRFDSGSQSWIGVPGTLTKISVGSDGDVWGVNIQSQVWHYNQAGQNWVQIGGVSLTQLSAGSDGSVWGLDASQSIYRYNPGTQSFSAVPGTLMQISVGGDGDVWGVNSASQIFHFNTLTQDWNLLPGSFSQVSVGAGSNVWALTSSGQISKFNNQTQNWDSTAGQLAIISAAANGAVWGTNSAGQIFKSNQSTLAANTLHQVPGTLSQLAVTPEGNLWGVTAPQQILHFNTQTQNWEQVPGALVQIAVGFGGSVWGINAQSQVWHFSSSTQLWSQVAGQMTAVRVSSNGSVWTFDARGNVWQYNAQSQSLFQIPGSVVDLEVGADGSLWGLNAKQQIWRYNSQAGSWTQLPGALTQISVGSAANVAGVNAQSQIWRYDPASAASWDFGADTMKSVAVAFDGATWAVSTGNQISRFNSQTQTWNGFSGSYTQVVVGGDAAVWALDPNGSVYFFR